MKIKLIAVAVAGILLSGCNDDNGEVIGLSVQAFDPAIQYMTAVAECDNAPTETSITGYDGNAKFLTSAPLYAPETCKFTFTGGVNAIDVSNGKSMTGVVYTIPKGMAQAGSSVTASPLTTLIAKELNGAAYSEGTASTVLGNLGLGDLVNSLANDGVDIAELLSNTESVLEKLTVSNSDGASLLAATTAVLSDVLKEDPSATPTQLAKSTDSLADAVIASEPNYPKNSSGTVVTITVTPTDINSVVDDVKADIAPTVPPQVPVKGDPVKPTDPPTSGGSGADSGAPSGGSGD